MFPVGFGDCFLLSFLYKRPRSDQHILIDFGTVGGKADMHQVAKDIKAACNGKLYAVVATHRHRDHISGFSTKAGENSTGKIIASCEPEVVVQPWTEDPKAAPNAQTAGLLSDRRNLTDKQLYFASMLAMTSVAEHITKVGSQFRASGNRKTSIEKIAETNVSNPEAVLNLQKMGKQPPRFVHYDSPSGLEDRKLLPGVKVRVLGPPTLAEANIKKYAKNSDEYWIATKYWGLQENSFSSIRKKKLFPSQAAITEGQRPFHTRWFTDRADATMKGNVLGMVTALDNFLNNTSVILLFEVKGKKLLFPGDAQLENWSYALGQKGVKELLTDVDLYKVGHHGSRNATPQSLWDSFKKRGSPERSGVLKTMMSSAPGVYNRSAEGQVPLPRLVTELKTHSSFESTLGRKAKDGPVIIEF